MRHGAADLEKRLSGGVGFFNAHTGAQATQPKVILESVDSTIPDESIESYETSVQ